MKIRHIDHVGVIVKDLAAVKEFFLDVGLEVQWEAELEGEWVGQIIGLTNVKSRVVMMRAPGSQTGIEFSQFISPLDERGIQELPSNALGIRHVAFVVEDMEAMVARLMAKGTRPFNEIYNYLGQYKICYVHGPEGIILELDEEVK